MSLFVWAPPSYGTPPLRVRRNPGMWRQEPALPVVQDTRNMIIGPNGGVSLEGAVDDALASLEASGPRGAAALGAVAGLVFGGWKGGAIGGILGYLGGRYLVNFATKALAVSAAAGRVESAVAKAVS